MFSLVHAITDNPWAVGEATRDVIRDFAADGVVYLELRTTPRQVPGSGVLDPNSTASVIVGFLGNNMGKKRKKCV
jgi:adenosine deaminase